MITIKAVLNDKGGIKPESIPDNHKGSHCDGTNFYFFESDKERVDFLNALPKQEVKEIEPEKVDLIGILSKATLEEIEFLKQALK